MRYARLPHIVLALLTILCAAAGAGELHSDLTAMMQTGSPDAQVTVWIRLTPSQSVGRFKTAVLSQAQTRMERHALAVRQLRRDHQQAQRSLVEQLERLQQAGKVSELKTYWIANVVRATVALGELEQLAARPDVEQVIPVTQPSSIKPERTRTLPHTALGTDSITSNLGFIRADEAWGMGFTGAGRVICSFDTGVDGVHPALFDNWKGHDGDSAAAWFDPIFGEPFPHVSSDLTPSHGTHVLGIACGHDAGRDFTTGVAPDAKWISAAVIDITGASILDAFEWAADPDGDPNTIADVPDVINHSWGFPKTALGCENIFFDAIRNTEALGIVNIISAGNTAGQFAIYNPANGALDSLDCFAVGAINTNNVPPTLHSTSSQGPSDCNATIVKPNMVAPGYQITSAFPGNLYALATGTSMASPHVSGLVALLRQKNPNATVDEIKEAMIGSAQWDASWGISPNNQFGWGAIDCVAALNALSAANTKGNIRLYEFTHDPIAAGDTVEGTLLLQNVGEFAEGLLGGLGSGIEKDQVAVGSRPEIVFRLIDEIVYAAGNACRAGAEHDPRFPEVVAAAFEPVAITDSQGTVGGEVVLHGGCAVSDRQQAFPGIDLESQLQSVVVVDAVVDANIYCEE